MDNITEVMEALQLPFAYDHFAEGEGPDPPFICFLLPGSDNFAADGRVYFKATMVHIELYTDLKDPELEQRVEAVLDERGIFYDKTEVWIESEQLYEVLYSFEMEVSQSRIWRSSRMWPISWPTTPITVFPVPLMPCCIRSPRRSATTVT